MSLAKTLVNLVAPIFSKASYQQSRPEGKAPQASEAAATPSHCRMRGKHNPFNTRKHTPESYSLLFIVPLCYLSICILSLTKWGLCAAETVLKLHICTIWQNEILENNYTSYDKEIFNHLIRLSCYEGACSCICKVANRNGHLWSYLWLAKVLCHSLIFKSLKREPRRGVEV